MKIERVAVLGSGVMGSGIAAQVANAGYPVTLLDIVPEGANDRNRLAAGAVERMLKQKPAPFMDRRNARLVSVGNLEDDLHGLESADWIVEAVIERADIKRDLYRRLEQVRKPGSVVSSNTSTIPIATLMEDMPDSLRQDFMITHFFNPPRYMPLLELVTAPENRADSVDAVREFCDRALGKGVVRCKDTPGFIGNRIGVYWLQCAVAEALNLGLKVEAADAVMGRPVGVPKTAVFGLLDLIGIDLMPHVLASMQSSLPADDPLHEYEEIPPLLRQMIDDGYTGRKGKGGFYRLHRNGHARVKQVIDLQTGDYADATRPLVPSVEAAKAGGMRALVEYDDDTGRYAWRVLSNTLHYAASLVPEIADDVVAVDEAMRLGYNWKYGPFELMDRLGATWFKEKLEAEGRSIPAMLERAAASDGFYRIDGSEGSARTTFLPVAGDYAPVERADGVLSLSDIKLASKPVASNGAASLWDLGDGVSVLEFHTKMNAIEPRILDMVERSLEHVSEGGQGLVIYNEASNFSVGANLGLVLFAANTAAWEQLEGIVRRGQQVYKAIKYAPFPVVGAPAGMALGGGCEVLLHCDRVVAHAETYMGLVEVGVGLIPGWGGCKELLLRSFANPRGPKGPMAPIGSVFEAISTAKVSTSAAEAKRSGFLRPEDEIVMNRSRVLAQAKVAVRKLASDYAAPEPVELSLPGASARAAMSMLVDSFHQVGKATDYDVVVAQSLSQVLTGGHTDVTEWVTEDELLDLEVEQFMGLLRNDATLARMEHMLDTGKPLRN